MKNHAKAAGIENFEDFSSRSMRRGLATTAIAGNYAARMMETSQYSDGIY